MAERTHYKYVIADADGKPTVCRKFTTGAQELCYAKSDIQQAVWDKIYMAGKQKARINIRRKPERTPRPWDAYIRIYPEMAKVRELSLAGMSATNIALELNDPLVSRRRVEKIITNYGFAAARRKTQTAIRQAERRGEEAGSKAVERARLMGQEEGAKLAIQQPLDNEDMQLLTRMASGLKEMVDAAITQADPLKMKRALECLKEVREYRKTVLAEAGKDDVPEDDDWQARLTVVTGT